MDSKADFSLAKHIEGVKYREQRKDINVASYLDHSKLVITQILEHKNRLLVRDLRKNKAKLVELLYSKYSPFADYVRKQKGGVALLDIVKFIQTNLLKLYVEMGNKKAIMNFFESKDNRGCIVADAAEID